MNTEEYREALETAYKALADLLRASEPGTGVLLHQACAMLKREVDRREPKEAQAVLIIEREQRDRLEREKWLLWQRTPEAERRHWVLNALADGSSSTSEIAERIGQDHDGFVFDRNIKPTLAKMLADGEVTRAKEPRTPGGTAWLWSYRRADVSPEILELERAFSGDDGAVA